MKFLIDMPLSPALADWLKARGHDAVHAIHLAMGRSPDSDILERARIDERIVITADLDYPRLLAITRAEGPGLILFRGGNYSDQEAFERMERVLETTTPENLDSLYFFASTGSLTLLQEWDDFQDQSFSLLPAHLSKDPGRVPKGPGKGLL